MFLKIEKLQLMYQKYIILFLKIICNLQLDSCIKEHKSDMEI